MRFASESSKGWSKIGVIKRIGQTGIAVFNVFLGPMPVPVQLAVWPRIIVGLAIVAALPLLNLMRKPPWRGRTTGLAVLLLLIGLAGGVEYWLKLPTVTAPIRGAIYVVASPTAETLEELRRHDLRPEVGDMQRLIEGQAYREVESFYDSASLAANKLRLAILYFLFLAPTTIAILVFLEWIPERKRSRGSKPDE